MSKKQVAAALKVLTPDGLHCTQRQIAKAEKYLLKALCALSAETRRNELKSHQANQLKLGVEFNRARSQTAVKARWAAYGTRCKLMSNDTFRELSAPWNAPELAALLGISISRVHSYRRRVAAARVPDDVAEKLLAAIDARNGDALELPGLDVPTDC